jgi:Tfp pilus assembly protein PilO
MADPQETKLSHFASIKEILPIAAVLLVAAVIILYLSFSSYQKFLAMSDLENVLTEKRRELEHSESLLEELEELEAEWHLYDRQVLAFRAVIPSEYDEREMYEHIRNIMRFYNVSIEELTFQERQEKDGYYRFPVELTVQGQYGNVISALEEIQRKERVINITGIDIASGSPGRVVAEVHLETFSILP